MRRINSKKIFVAVPLVAVIFSFLCLAVSLFDQGNKTPVVPLNALELSGRDVYRADEAPKFVIDFPKPEAEPSSVARFLGVFGLNRANAAENMASALEGEATNYFDPNIKVAIKAEPDGDRVAITVPRPSGQFRPGQYALRLHIAGADKEEITRDFSWGVLAVNTDQSVYTPGETAYLQMGALTDVGSTICRGDLALELTDPAGNTATLSTKDGTIAYGKECRGNNVTDLPDYTAHYMVGTVGEYRLKLTNLKNNFSIDDSFLVQDSVPFKVERIGATRINPTRANYAMSFRVTANEAFAGEINETIPGSFAVTENGGAIIQAVGGDNVLTWHDIVLKPGEIKMLRYVYDAPNVSPKIYSLGPLRFAREGNLKWQEARRWQIAADATKTSAASTAWSTASTWNPSGVPAAGDDVVITGGYTVTITASVSNNPATITIGGATAGTLNFTPGSFQSYTLTVTGAVTVNSNGTFGVVNVSGGAAAHTLTIGGNLACGGTFNMVTSNDDYATVVFNGSSQQTISGAGATCTFFSLTDSNSSSNGLVLGRNVAVTPNTTTTTTVTVSANRTFDLSSYTINRTSTGAGTFTLNSGSTLLIGGTNTFPTNYTTYTLNAASTTNYDGTTQSVSAKTYGHLTLSASNTKTSAGVVTVAGNLTVGDGATFSHGAYNITVTGTTTVGAGTSGNLTISSATGTKQFTGLVTVSANATWDNSSANSAVNFRGGATNSGTFTAGTGIYTFNTNAQALTGTFSIPNVTVTGVTLTNNDSLTVGTALSGTGGLTNTATGTLNLGGTFGITTLTVSAAGNIVNYTGSSQAILAKTYSVLGRNGSGTDTLAGTVSATTLNVTAGTLNTNNQSLSVSGTTTVDGTLGITTGTSGTITFGSLTISATGTFNNTANDDFSISGDFSNSNSFSAGAGTTVTLAGAGGSTQAISGSSTFANLTATAASARTLQFAASSTTTITGTWTVTGASSQRITLTSTTTSQWNVNPASASVSYVDVNYSNNTSSPTICATYSISANGNNTKWSVSSGASCNTAPSFSGDPTDSPDPVVEGYDVTFTGTATDSQSDVWYLAVCKSNSVSMGMYEPQCASSQELCVSNSPVPSGDPNTCGWTSSGVGNQDWYAFACDATSCSSANTVNSPVTVQAVVVSMVLTTDGQVAYGTMPTNTSKSTCTSELNDAQVIQNNGNVEEDYLITGYDSANWISAATPDANQYVHKFSLGACSSFSGGTVIGSDGSAVITGQVPTGETRTVNLQITTPTSTSSYAQQAVNVTITASQYFAP